MGDRSPYLPIELRKERGTGPICRNGPKGASHKLDLSPFPWEETTMTSDDDERLRERATECPYEHACLGDDDRFPLCPLKADVGGAVVAFVTRKPPATCPYAMQWGYSSYICNCPIRLQVERRHDT